MSCRLVLRGPRAVVGMRREPVVLGRLPDGFRDRSRYGVIRFCKPGATGELALK